MLIFRGVYPSVFSKTSSPAFLVRRVFLKLLIFSGHFMEKISSNPKVDFFEFNFCDPMSELRVIYHTYIFNIQFLLWKPTLTLLGTNILHPYKKMTLFQKKKTNLLDNFGDVCFLSKEWVATWASIKNLVTFHYTDWLRGIRRDLYHGWL